MTFSAWSPLLDAPAVPDGFYGLLADRVAALLGTKSDVVFVQGEAIIALEAVAVSVARPGLKALNIVTSSYGGVFGTWLARSGAEVTDIKAEPGLPIEIDAVMAALDAAPGTRVLSMVHAESASGILNPLPEIARLCRERGVLLIVDAVASVGGHRLDVDELGIDIAVIGAQKSLGGSAGLSAVAVSGRAWAAMEGGASLSTLSLLDLKTEWLDRGRGALPGMPSALEFWALDKALERIEAEGLDAVIARHEQARTASRTGLRALGFAPWVADDSRASALVTAAAVPEEVDADALVAATERFGVGISKGVGPIAERLVRLNHTGQRAQFTPVLANVVAYGQALAELGVKVDVGAAAEAVAAAYAGQGGGAA
jgi:aspartate aminotransferase-like enzyme